MPCVFHWLTGLYCPGCGGTRALKYLLQGKILSSIQYHPLVFYVIFMACVELISWLVARVSGNRRWFLGHGEWLVYIGIAITAVNWIVKNVLLLGFGIDLMPNSLF